MTGNLYRLLISSNLIHWKLNQVNTRKIFECQSSAKLPQWLSHQVTCVKNAIDHFFPKINNRIDTVYINNDSCSSQFRPKFLVKWLTWFTLRYIWIATLTKPTVGKRPWMHSSHSQKCSFWGKSFPSKLKLAFQKVFSNFLISFAKFLHRAF